MPTLATPPENDAAQPAPDGGPPQRGRTGRGGGRYDYLDTHELIMLLDDVDDERAKARFREALYLAIILWLVLVLAYIFLPRWLPHRPVLIVQERNPNELTYLDTPPNLKELLKPKVSPRISERSTEAQSPKPTREPTPPEPKAGRPQPTPPPAAAKPVPQQQAPQPQQQAPPPQQQARATPPPVSKPTTPPIVDAPTPSQQRQPDFNNSRSASQSVQDAARGSRPSFSGDQQPEGNYGNAPRGRMGSGQAGYQILSDTQGVDFSRYIAQLLAQLRRNWLPLIPEECNSPLFKQGITGIRFTIQQNGQITGMNLDYSTHDEAINKAAWGSIKLLGAAAPLPKEFHGPNLELRIEFRVNKDRDMQ